ncbi:MAG: YfiR family protein [Bacteroidales bacterium]|nr:YfiR family protein [Bacteroidales bacterium]MBN2756956.1 YfiR family protein [Bacteroidales bacterium]
MDNIKKINNKIKLDKLLIWIIFTILFVINSEYKSYAQKVDEYNLKMAYILNFPLLVEWPENSNVNNENEPFVITIIGDNPFNGKFKAVIETGKKKIKNKTVVLRQVDNIEEIRNPNLVFISSSEKHEISKIIDYLSGKPILIIGDTEGYSNRGVMINMFKRNSKIQFNINIKEAKKSNMHISSRLLVNASKVYK